jgi:hypothetical protein
MIYRLEPCFQVDRNLALRSRDRVPSIITVGLAAEKADSAVPSVDSAAADFAAAHIAADSEPVGMAAAPLPRASHGSTKSWKPTANSERSGHDATGLLRAGADIFFAGKGYQGLPLSRFSTTNGTLEV